MAYIIEDNNVSHDSYALRLARLILLSANIDDYSAELGLDAGLLAWAQGALESDKTAPVSVDVTP